MAWTAILPLLRHRAWELSTSSTSCGAAEAQKFGSEGERAQSVVRGGAALAVPLVRAAAAIMAEMATFDGAGVTDKAG